MPERDIYASPRPEDGAVTIRVNLDGAWHEFPLPVTKADDFALDILNHSREVRAYWRRQAAHE